MTVDVIIPVYGHWELTERCLRALTEQTIPHRVVVVDDAGPDDTLQRLADHYPDVTAIAMAKNSGFGAACNAGIRAGQGDVVVLVNNDVEADAMMLERLVEAFDADPRLGSACPLLHAPDGTIDALGIAADVTMAGFVRLHGRDPSAASEPSHVLLGPYGAVAAYRRRALEDVGTFDEQIFMYGEELDLALRLAGAGWTTVAIESARGVHLGGASSGPGSAVQRERAGFGRGYLLRAYGVLTSRHVARAIVTELIVCFGDAIVSRDFAALRGRVKGWRAGRRANRRTRNIPALDTSIGFLESLRLRIGSRG